MDLGLQGLQNQPNDEVGRMASKPALKMTLKEDLATREDDEDEGQLRCNRWTCLSAPSSAKAKRMQLYRRRQMQARVNVARQASTSEYDALSSVLPCFGTHCAKEKEEMPSACDLEFKCAMNSAIWMHL